LKLNSSFYLQDDVVRISKSLLGKTLCTFIDGIYTSGIITETEAYAGITDKASHAYGNRYTPRTAIMYKQGGLAYVYLCYGIHSLFNVVTNIEGIPHAVLIRAVKPLDGIQEMLKRRKKSKADATLTSGPGTLAQALGIHYRHSGLSLVEDAIWIEESENSIRESDIISGPRIGVAYAAEDALLPYRFRILL
jgi:DNA-3-methyladenine glycosylase